MNQEIKQRWTDALRSGQYIQTKRTLRRADCFCAVGVLCDIYSKEKNIGWEDANKYSEQKSILGICGVAPDEIEEWAGLDDISLSPATSNSYDRVIKMNDNSNCTFEQIAEYIDKNL